MKGFPAVIALMLGVAAGVALSMLYGVAVQPGFERGYRIGACTVHVYTQSSMSEGAARATCTNDGRVREMILDQPIRPKQGRTDA